MTYFQQHPLHILGPSAIVATLIARQTIQAVRALNKEGQELYGYRPVGITNALLGSVGALVPLYLFTKGAHFLWLLRPNHWPYWILTFTPYLLTLLLVAWRTTKRFALRSALPLLICTALVVSTFFLALTLLAAWGQKREEERLVRQRWGLPR